MKKLLLLIFLSTILFSCSKNNVTDVPHRWQNTDIDFYLNKEANPLTETIVSEPFHLISFDINRFLDYKYKFKYI